MALHSLTLPLDQFLLKKIKIFEGNLGSICHIGLLSYSKQVI